ncbi:hypothetical protein K439DRAFT_1618499 [Ramaria rubella]|nr:hypothetical protein K439DRAFT_1618499 [Ramaria rubella]
MPPVTLKGMDPFNVITHAIFFLLDPRHLVSVQSRHGMAYIHQHQVPHTPTCTVAATAACMWSYKDTRYVDTSIVKPEGKSGWPEGILCACEVAAAWPISTSTMYHTHLHALLLPTVCSLQHKGMSACPQIQVSQGGLEVAVTCSIFTSTRCHTLACIFAATAMRMWYLT